MKKTYRGLLAIILTAVSFSGVCVAGKNKKGINNAYEILCQIIPSSERCPWIATEIYESNKKHFSEDEDKDVLKAIRKFFVNVKKNKDAIQRYKKKQKNNKARVQDTYGMLLVNLIRSLCNIERIDDEVENFLDDLKGESAKLHKLIMDRLENLFSKKKKYNGRKKTSSFPEIIYSDEDRKTNPDKGIDPNEKFDVHTEEVISINTPGNESDDESFPIVTPKYSDSDNESDVEYGLVDEAPIKQ